MMDHEEEEILAYYHWEGDPCRIIAATDGINLRYAQIYVAGQGFEDISLTDLMINGVEISEREFKSLIMEAIHMAKQKA